MNSRLITILLVVILVMVPLAVRQPVAVAAASRWRLALPGYKYDFPRDLASHDDYKTEWWYYTGHLYDDQHREYGYELTFFRSGMDIADGVQDSPWTVKNAYMAHFAVSDIPAQRFFHAQKLNRAGINFAGASDVVLKVWNENWHVVGTSGKQLLAACAAEYAIQLSLTSTKSVVLNGENGVSQKASCVGCASHYFSLTRLQTDGELTVRGKRIHVSGISWMDHEFGSNQLTEQQVGWDWFSIQLDNRTELMLYAMRRRDGTVDPHSSGTFVESDGTARHLRLAAYHIEPTGSWTSPHTHAVYPMGWHVTVPDTGVDLFIEPLMRDQELVSQSATDVTYWEGASRVKGTVAGKPVTGQAYVEMTGYGKAFSKNI